MPRSDQYVYHTIAIPKDSGLLAKLDQDAKDSGMLADIPLLLRVRLADYYKGVPAVVSSVPMVETPVLVEEIDPDQEQQRVDQERKNKNADAALEGWGA